jgi:hypothetical protein
MTRLLSGKSKVLLVGDLGSSASKFFYRVGQGSVHPLWMGAEVATDVSQTLLALMGVGGGGRPQDSAWLQMGGEVVLVGEAAKALLERNSMRAHKAELAVYKMAAALGVVAELEDLPQGFEVVFWLALPLTELGTREASALRLKLWASPALSFVESRFSVGSRSRSIRRGLGSISTAKTSWTNWDRRLISAIRWW